ncbi:hypothetical protein [Rhizobium binxianense]|uniref:hypothetical protein n=1 Tax=Rhizobium binxianense TaxID=3024242 RepID=UPI00235E46A4|nr:hypothetical protein [Rhizobium sp. MJ37]MDC9835549.1 hypothetical protein [Rhizobium sp. MJ37]
MFGFRRNALVYKEAKEAEEFWKGEHKKLHAKYLELHDEYTNDLRERIDKSLNRASSTGSTAES